MGKAAALIATLNEGKVNLEKLVELAQAKQRAIVENRRETLLSLSRQEMALVKELNHWEGRRAAIAAQTAPGENLTLSTLMTQVDEEERKTLAALQEELLNLINRLVELNRQNTELLSHALAYLQYFMSLLRGGERESGVYSQHKNQVEPAASTLVDRLV